MRSRFSALNIYTLLCIELTLQFWPLLFLQTYLNREYTITWTRFDSLAVNKIRLRQELWEVISQSIATVITNIGFKPFKQLPVSTNEWLNLVNQHILVNDLLGVKVEDLQEFFIDSLVVEIFLDAVKKFNFFSGDNRLVG